MAGILKVDKYQDFNGNDIMTSDGSGNITLSTAMNTAVVSGTNNTPAFQAYRSSGQSISTSTLTKIQFNSELFDTDSAYDSSTNYRFTPQTSGKYYVYALLRSTSINSVFSSQQQTYIYKNGSNATGVQGAEIYDFYNGANLDLTIGMAVIGVVELNGSTDYVECFHQSDAGSPWVSGTFGAYKIIGA